MSHLRYIWAALLFVIGVLYCPQSLRAGERVQAPTDNARAAASNHPKTRRFIDLQPYRGIKSVNNVRAPSSHDQSRHTFLITHLGMTNLEANAFEYVNRRYSNRISEIVMDHDPAGLDSKSLEKIVKINDQRDDWLKKRLGESQYQLFLEFEEREFFRNGNF